MKKKLEPNLSMECRKNTQKTEGNVTYEELKSGDKVILDRALLHWYPDIKVGDKLKLNIHDGDNTFQKEIEVAAIGEYGTGLTNYNCLIMAKEGRETYHK